MRLNGFNSFLGSFILSLFMIFSINSSLTHSSNASYHKITPHGNVTVFLKKNSPSKVAPSHIALTKPDFRSHQKKDKVIVSPPSLEKKELPPALPDFKISSSLDSSSPVKNSSEKDIAPKNELFLSRTPSVKPLYKPHAPSKEVKDDIVLASSTVEKLHSEVSLSPLKTDTEEAPKEKVSALEPPSPETVTNKKTEQNTEGLLIPLEKEDNGAHPFIGNSIINPPSAASQVAMSDVSAPLSALTDSPLSSKSLEKDDTSSKEWETMAAKHNSLPKERPVKDVYERPQLLSNDTPWVVAKGAPFPKNETITEQNFYKDDDNLALSADLSSSSHADNKGSKLAGEVVNNILIPIPEDILENKDLMPDLVSNPQNKPLEEKLKEKEAITESEQDKNNDDIPFITVDDTPQPQSSAKESQSSGLFSSLTSLFSSKDKTPLTEEATPSPEENNDDLDISSFQLLSSGKKNLKILPSEIRLSFQPDRAEISGKTLDWLRAFAQKALENEDVSLEIRIDGSSSYTLQQKRLNLLYNILTNLGLGYSKVHTVFTARDPNSFILRAIKTDHEPKKEQFNPAASYYRS